MLIISIEIDMLHQHGTTRERGSSITEHWRPSLVDDIQADGPTPTNAQMVSHQGRRNPGKRER